MTGTRPNYALLELASQGSDRQVDPWLADALRELARPSAVDLLAAAADGDVWAGEVARVRRGLHRALDFSAHGSLCGSFLMQVMDIEWERLGGKRDDPAPWREAFE